MSNVMVLLPVLALREALLDASMGRLDGMRLLCLGWVDQGVPPPPGPTRRPPPRWEGPVGRVKRPTPGASHSSGARL